MSEAEVIFYHVSHVNAAASVVMASLILGRVSVQKCAILLGVPCLHLKFKCPPAP